MNSCELNHLVGLQMYHGPIRQGPPAINTIRLQRWFLHLSHEPTEVRATLSIFFFFFFFFFGTTTRWYAKATPAVLQPAHPLEVQSQAKRFHLTSLVGG
jgi:hypothetical protein